VLALVAAILAGLALLGVVGLGALVLGQDAMGDADWLDEESGAGPTMTGVLPSSHRVGTGLDGQGLVKAITPVIENDFGSVDSLTCPATGPVTQNVTTVCHAMIDDEEWAVVVFFEDPTGHFTLLPI
jgi:uncharacterized protein DUF4333